MVLVDVQYPKVPKSAFIPQKVGVRQLSHKASKVFSISGVSDSSSKHHPRQARLAWIRSHSEESQHFILRPRILEMLAIQNLHVFSSLLLHHGAKERINASR